MENLNVHPDFLIRDFRFEIIIILNKEDLVPSWAWLEIYKFEEENKCKPLRDLLFTNTKEHRTFNENKEKELELIKSEIVKFEKKLAKPNKKQLKVLSKLQKTKFKFIIYFLTKKLAKLEKRILSFNQSIYLFNDKISEINNEIKTKEKSYNKEVDRINKELHYIKSLYNTKRNDVKKLQISVFENPKNNDFIPLINIFSFNQEQFAGVYIIKNNENNKCYVGQSKNVIKRLKQHFKGTVPKNFIFAEDYYLSKDKENLFSVKIIKLQTKDELDDTERKLIEKYDSFENGYNKTNGNV